MNQQDLFDPPSLRSKAEIQKILDLAISGNRRLLEFLVDQKSEFATEWGIPIPRGFYNALDIRESSIVIGTLLDGVMYPPGTNLAEHRDRARTIRQLRISQGSNFSFSARDTIYDSIGAYLLPPKTWADCLKEFRFRIEIERAASAGEKYAGSVRYRVDENRTQKPGSMFHIGTFDCSQHEFVRRLIIGIPAILENP